MPPRGFVLRPPLALSPSVCKGAYFDALCVLLRMRYSSYPLGSRHGALVLGGEREKRRRGRKRKKVLCGFFFFFFSFFSPTTPAINHNHTSTKAFQRESSEYLSLLLCSFLLRFDRSSQHHRNHSPGPDRKPLTLSLFSPLSSPFVISTLRSFFSKRRVGTPTPYSFHSFLFLHPFNDKTDSMLIPKKNRKEVYKHLFKGEFKRKSMMSARAKSIAARRSAAAALSDKHVRIPPCSRDWPAPLTPAASSARLPMSIAPRRSGKMKAITRTEVDEREKGIDARRRRLFFFFLDSPSSTSSSSSSSKTKQNKKQRAFSSPRRTSTSPSTPRSRECPTCRSSSSCSP